MTQPNAIWTPEQQEQWLADYEIRYLACWPDLARLTRELVGNRCCFPGCKSEGSETHHAFYLGPDASAVRLTPGVELFYLCDFHHGRRTHYLCAHNWRNWEAADRPPGWTAHQKIHYYKLLIRGWQEKRLLAIADNSRCDD